MKAINTILNDSKLFVLASIVFAPCFASTTAIHLPDVNMKSVYSHQKELVGRNRIPNSLVDNVNSNQIIAEYVLDITSDGLPKKYKGKAQKVASAIIKEANKYGMDPLFLAAVIQQESSFNPDQVGTVKELGLMQVRPETAQWLNKKYHIVKKLNLRDPVTNIKIGTFFLNSLRDRFDKNSRHYISAYNMGAAKLRQNLRNNKNPKEYVQNVMKHYVKYMQDLSDMAKTMDDSINSMGDSKDLVQMPLPSLASN